jgi:cobalt-zinc-cadmium efflux system membrane fusion protein
MNIRFNRKMLLCLVELAGVLVLFASCRPSEKTEDTTNVQVSNSSVTLTTNSPQLSALTVEPVEATAPTRVSLAGRLVWDEDITVRVFSPFAGIVRNLPVDLNQHVAKGNPLAEIQSSDFVQAQADARKAETDLRRTRQNLDRLKDLFDHGASPRKDLEAAEADFASAQAERDRAQARLAIYGATVGSADAGFLLPSPLDGILVERNVTPGQEVRPDQMLANTPQFTAPLFVVTDPARLWIQIDATELDLPYLRQGCDFTFTSHAFPGQTFTGRVDTVSAFVDTATHTIKVRGTVDNSRRLLKAEMFVNVSLPGMETAAVSVPAKAVYLHGEKHYVFVEQEPGKFARQEVRTGAEENGKILVLAGIQSGQRVVTDGCVLLQETLK